VIRETRSSVVRGQSIKVFHVGVPLRVKRRSDDHTRCIIPGLNLTSHAKFATLADVGELPGPSIVASTPIIRPLKSGGSAVADARHP